MDPTYPLIPVLNLLGAALSLLTLFTSVQKSWNAGIIMLCAWLFLACVIVGIETIVWADNANDYAPVWCDICKYVLDLMGLFANSTTKLVIWA